MPILLQKELRKLKDYCLPQQLLLFRLLTTADLIQSAASIGHSSFIIIVLREIIEPYCVPRPNLHTPPNSERTSGFWGTFGELKLKKALQIPVTPFSAEREGFEPPDPLRSTVFKTAAFDHSAISPILSPKRDLLPLVVVPFCKGLQRYE